MSKEREAYESMIGGILSHVWRREGETLVCDPADASTPLVELLGREDAKHGAPLEYLPAELAELRYMARSKLAALVVELVDELQQARRNTQAALLNFLFEDGPDMLRVLERLFIFTRAARMDAVWRMSQTEMAAMFGHTRQNWQLKEKALIEELVQRWGRAEFVKGGGKKYSARVAYSMDRKGNHNRKSGRLAADDMPPLPPPEEDFPLTKRAKTRAVLMMHEAERRRIAKLCGGKVKPGQIDLGKIDPDEGYPF